jgi:hypothetical protein
MERREETAAAASTQARKGRVEIDIEHEAHDRIHRPRLAGQVGMVLACDLVVTKYASAGCAYSCNRIGPF